MSNYYESMSWTPIRDRFWQRLSIPLYATRRSQSSLRPPISPSGRFKAWLVRRRSLTRMPRGLDSSPPEADRSDLGRLVSSLRPQISPSGSSKARLVGRHGAGPALVAPAPPLVIPAPLSSFRRRPESRRGGVRPPVRGRKPTLHSILIPFFGLGKAIADAGDGNRTAVRDYARRGARPLPTYKKSSAESCGSYPNTLRGCSRSR